MKKDKKNLKTTIEKIKELIDKPFQYWFDSTSIAYVMTCCQDWFGVKLEYEEAQQVHKQLSVYPAPERDEAIETVLFIYFAKSK